VVAGGLAPLRLGRPLHAGDRPQLLGDLAAPHLPLRLAIDRPDRAAVHPLVLRGADAGPHGRAADLRLHDGPRLGHDLDLRPHVVVMLAGRVAVVLGGTAGIGRAVSLALADAGAEVVAAARRPAELEATAAEIERRGRRTLRVPADVTDRASLERLRDE